MRLRPIVGVVVLLVVLLFIASRTSQNPSATDKTITPSPSPESTEPLPGELLLEAYANPESSVHDDLQSMHALLMTVRTLVKTIDPARLATNEDVVDVLLGRNPYKERFLPDEHPAINSQRQLIDRWETPLFFHLEAADRLDVRSAGPDKQLFTADDVHLHADGTFMPPDEVATPSLR